MNKICIIASFSSIYAGNFIPTILNFANLARNKGDIVVFAFPSEAKDRYWVGYLIERGFEVLFFENSTKWFLRKFRKFVRSQKIDTIYAHFISPLLLKTTLLFSRVKLLIHVHSDFSANKKESCSVRLKKYLGYKLNNKHSFFIFVSDALCKQAAIKKSIYLPNAFCEDRIPIPNKKGNITKKFFGIRNEDFVFLTFAWEPYIKGLDVTVSAFNSLKSDNVSLLVVCGSDDGVKSNINWLLKRKIEVSNRVFFISPFEDVFALFNVANCFISASRSEGFPYAILEALYSNKTIIISNIDGTKWANKYKCVHCFESECSVDLATKMNYVLKNNDVVKGYREFVLKEFNIDEFNKKIYETLKVIKR